MTRVHYLLRSKRRTACGRAAGATAKDTRQAQSVTCKVCERVLKVKRRECKEYGE
jgi:hypothetical protein